MITKNQIRFVKSLQQKKYRNENRLFVVEGRKNVAEVFASDFVIQITYVSRLSELPDELAEYEEISSKDMDRISGLKSSPGILSVVEMRDLAWDGSTKGLTIILDNIKDPGNLGTIIRSANWFGVSRVICSKNTVDLWNPKVVQATMGAIFRVPVFYNTLENVVEKMKDNNVPTFAAILDGENLYDISFSDNLAIIIGSESHGISPEIIQQASNSVTIPSFGNAESLNASIACAVILGVLRR